MLRSQVHWWPGLITWRCSGLVVAVHLRLGRARSDVTQRLLFDSCRSTPGRTSVGVVSYCCCSCTRLRVATFSGKSGTFDDWSIGVLNGTFSTNKLYGAYILWVIRGFSTMGREKSWGECKILGKRRKKSRDFSCLGKFVVSFFPCNCWCDCFARY